MTILWLFDSCGYIFGPAIIAAGVAALVVCAWMTFRSTTARLQRLAVPLATLPVILGVCGFLVGLVICWSADIGPVPWLVLGKVILAGAVVSVVPLLWALFLRRIHRNSGLRAAADGIS